ncbi:hypothetical protein CEXT_15391 [Caerostris extrusa]|uniref:Uncharacterized protein n=1 Tax=Caerostris extrusa TaxID=172846 RepID=A0AAV4VCR6_CAEEX|nr:hypothetical protein CEXT_15391 [Caerostris extrusa]
MEGLFSAPGAPAAKYLVRSVSEHKQEQKHDFPERAPAAKYLVRSVSEHKQEQNMTFRKVMDDIYLRERSFRKQLLCGISKMSPSVGLDERKNTAAPK